MRDAVVTGGAGFIGSAVTRSLVARGFSVRVIGASSMSDPLTPAGIAAALESTPELVVHCAGSSSVAASVVDPSGEHAKTVPPFAALLAGVRERAPAARVVLLSSAAVYGAARVVPTPETEPPAPRSPYGEHKRVCEELCRASGLATIVLRLFSVYGPGLRRQLLWDACRKARAGALELAGTGDEERDWLHVDDAVGLVLAAAEHASTAAPVINGGTGIATRVRDVVATIGHELGAPARFTGTVRAGDPPRYVADIMAARALGWLPRVPFERGLAEYVAWFRTEA
jgi:UDP-glucose 4-epimerase